jgi:hypothetical protein
MTPRLERILTACLGGLWLIDGILQLQPAMFTNTFVQTVLAPNLQGEPSVIANIIAFGIRLWNVNMVFHNWLSAIIQLAIGLFLLSILVLPSRSSTWFKVRRFALWLSLAWALVIWIFGEGFGLLLTGSATFYTGAPGSVLLYAILTIFLLYASRNTSDDGEQSNSLLKKLPLATGILFLLCAVLNLAPMFWQPTMLSMLAMTPTASGWLGTFGAQGTLIGNLIAVDILACLGIFLIVAPSRRVAWTAIIFLVIVWWLGQSFGGIQTFPSDTATDPNSAPLFALFLLPALLEIKKPDAERRAEEEISH